MIRKTIKNNDYLTQNGYNEYWKVRIWGDGQVAKKEEVEVLIVIYWLYLEHTEQILSENITVKNEFYSQFYFCLFLSNNILFLGRAVCIKSKRQITYFLLKPDL